MCEHFIDEDFGRVIGIAYWFTYSSVFAAQNLMAANLAVYWGFRQVWQIIIFYFVTPGVTVGINLVGVGIFGWIEAVGGILKIILVVGVTIVLYVMAAQGKSRSTNYIGLVTDGKMTEGFWSGDGPIQDGFVYNAEFTTNKYRALAYVIPMVAFGFLGIETVAVTAFEARTSRSLRLPSQSIAYVTLLLYFLCLLGQCLNVSWKHDHLPLIYGGIGDGATDTKDLKDPASSSLTILALWAWEQKHLAGFLNGAMIFSVLSASNTSLYVASRTLYGVARDVPRSNLLGRWINGLSEVVPKTGVPARALVFSAVAFIWLPFISLKGGYAVQYLIEIIQISSSNEYEQFKRGIDTYKPFTVLAFAQPFPAIISIVGCLIILAFCSATWWDKEVTFSKVAIGYAAPIILFILFIVFKLINRRFWIRTSDDFSDLSQTLDRLKWYKQDEMHMSPQRHHDEATRVLSPPQVASPPEGSQQEIELVEIVPPK
ncbi:Nn.00g101760.m01.CDS01 [Neocucurbitaria sp. VM-36]